MLGWRTDYANEEKIFRDGDGCGLLIKKGDVKG